jgi:O-antigen/teichoic acid export membrane protein
MAVHYTAMRVRRGALYFVVGKVVTAALTLLGIGLVARELTQLEYGVYAVAVAGMELGLALATFGLDWVAARAIPDIRENGSGRALIRYVWQLGLLQSVLVVLVAAMAAMLADTIADLLVMPTASAALKLYALVMAVEGVGRIIRDQFLGALLHQKDSQLSQLARVATFVLLMAGSETGATAVEVARIDLLASVAGLCVGACFLCWRLSRERRRLPSDPGWRVPAASTFFRLASNTYGSYLLSLSYSGQVLTLLVARMLGADAVAIFGLARQIADQVRRYLPTDLFMSLVRPAMVAAYTSGGGLVETCQQARILLLGSVLVLAPILIFGIAYGGIILELFGGESFSEDGLVLAGLLVVLVPFSVRRVIELVANIALRSHVCFQASVLLFIVPLVSAAALALGGGLLWVSGAMMLGEVIFVLFALRGLARSGAAFALPARSLFKVGLVVAVSVGSLSFLFGPSMISVGGKASYAVVLGGTMSVLAFGLIASFVKPLTADDRLRLMRAMGVRWIPF